MKYFAWPFLFLAQAAAPETQPLPPRSVPLNFEISAGKNTKIAQGGMTVLSEIFKKHGYTLNFEELPLQRSLFELKSGRLDGSAGRIAETAQLYDLTDYERLNVPITYATLALWCHKDYQKKSQVRRIKLGYLRGSVMSMKLAQSTEPKKVDAISLKENKVGAVMLFNGRIDCMLAFVGNFEDDIGPGYDLSKFSRHALVTQAYYTWIKKSLLPLKNELEDDLRNFPFPKEWAEKYRTPQNLCHNQLDAVCPDSVIFK